MTAENSPAAPAPRKRKTLRRILIAAGVLGVGAIGLVVLAPTLLSTGAGKGFVLGQVNNSLNGRVEVGSWSLGWFSGVRLEDIKVYDDQKRLAISVGSISTELTVLQAIRGDFQIGETVIDSPNLVLVEVYTDGSTNLQRMVKGTTDTTTDTTKSTSSAAPAPSAAQPTATATPATPAASIPNVQGNVTVKNLTGTIQGEAVGAPVRIGSSSVLVKIPDLATKPVTNEIKLVVGRDGQAMGTVSILGEAQAIFAGKVDTTKLTATETVALSNVDLGALSPLLAASGLKVAGIANGVLNIKAAGLDSATVQGQFALADFSAGGAALKGDTLRMKVVAVPIDLSTAKAADGSVLVTIRKAGIESAELTAVVSGEVAQSALINLADSKAPGSTGRILLAANVPDVGALAAQLRATLGLGADAQVTSGAISATLDLGITNTAASLVGTTNLTGVRGTRAGQPVAIADITTSYDINAGFDTTGLSTLNINKAALNSSFANLAASGTLNDLKYTAQLDLGRAQQEISQFADLGGIDMAGRVTSQGSVNGDFAKGGDLAVLSSTAVSALRLAMPAKGESPALSVAINAMQADVSAGVSKAGEVQTVALRKASAQIGGLTVNSGGRDVLRNETLTVSTAGELRSGAGTRVALTALDLTSSSNLVTLRQQGDTLIVDIKPDGAMAASGGLAFDADLARLSQVAAAWSGGKPSDLRAGSARGQLAFSTAGQSSTAKGNVDLTGLVVGDLIRNENLAVTFDASSADAFKSVSATATLASSFANLSAKDARLSLTGGTWDLVQSANLTVRIDDLAKLDALSRSMTPPVAGVEPLIVRSGALTTDVNVARKGSITTLDIAALKVTGLELSKATASYRMPNDVDVQISAAIDAATGNGTTTADQIKSVTVSKLDGSLGVAAIKLAEPIVLTDLKSTSPSAKGRVNLSGRIQTVTGMMEVLGGSQPGSKYPYVGSFTVDQAVTSSGGMTSLSGSAVLSNLQVLDTRGQPVVSEERLEIANDLGVNLTTYDVKLTRLGVNAVSSGALNVEATGLIRDAMVARRFEEPLNLKLSYDLARLMPLLVPIMDPEGATFGGSTFDGKHQKEFIVTGAYPANLAPAEAIRMLKATGGLAIGSAKLPRSGVELSALDQDFTLENGILTFPTSKPATFNGGTLDVSGLTVNLTEATPRLSAPPNKPVLREVALNKFLGDRAGWMGSFLLKGNDEASGRMNLDLVKCDRLPLGELAKQAVPENDGSAELNLTIRDLRLVGGSLGDILSQLKGVGKLTQGELKQGRVVVANGVVTQEIDYRMSVGQIRTDGGINLGPKTFRPLTVYIAPAFLQGAMSDFGSKLGLGFLGENLGNLGDLPITITGTVDKPRYNVGESFKTYAGNAFKSVGGIGGGLLNKLTGQDKTPPPTAPGQETPTTKPAEPDPLGSLLKGLGGNDKPKDKPKPKKK